MHTNLQLINPSKENGLFSIHKYQKMTLSNYSSNYSSNSYYNTIYKPFNTHKYSLSSLHKTKKFGVTLTNMNSKSNTHYNLKKNLLSHVPYPSFPNNNKIPAIYKNSIKTQKYPKIMKNNNFTVYNFNKQTQKDINIKNLLFNSNRNKINKTFDKMQKGNNKQNRTYIGGRKFLKFNDIFNQTNKIINKDNFDKKEISKIMTMDKKIKIKPNLKINNFNNILGNIIHLIEMRDEHNNNIIYTKVTNLLLDEINKLLELQKKRYELEKLKNISTYKKIRINKKKLNISNDVSKRKNKHLRTLNIKSIDLKFQQKYGFDFDLDDSYLNNGAKTDLSIISKDASYNNLNKEFYRKGKIYKNEYGQTNESDFKNSSNNIFKGNFKTNEIYENKNLNDEITKNNINKDNKNNEFDVDNKNKGNSLLNNFIKGNNKKNEKKQKIKPQRITKNNKQNEEKFDFSNMLSNLATKVEEKLEIKKKGENKEKKNSTTEKDIPIFEQMVKNDRLIKLIHNYLNYLEENEEENEDEENIENEEIKNKENNESNNENKNIKNEIDEKLEEKKNEEKRKLIIEIYRKNLVKNVKIERKKKRAKTYIIQKVELGMEIIKHICDEINISKNEKDIILNCLYNLLRISRKVNKNEKEEILQKKLLKPINEITRKYLENMLKINDSNVKPKGLFNGSLKNFLKAKLNEILNIANEDNNVEEEEKKKRKDSPKKRKKESPKKQKKKLIFDNSYFFKKETKNKRHKSIDQQLIESNINDDDNENKENVSSMNSENHGSKKIFINKSDSKFIKTKKLGKGLKILFDEKEEKIIKDIKEEKIILTNEDILDKRLQAFFGKIKELRNIYDSKDEEKLKLFLDKELEKFDYTREKTIEARKYNFFNELRVARYVSVNGKYSHNNKLLYHSPLVFNILKDK